MPDNSKARISATSMKANSLPAPVPRGARPPSDTLVDIHVYLVPKEKWVEKRKLAKNQVIDFSISSGFVRVVPTITLADLRREIHRQLGYDVIPRQYVFLRSVGRNFTQVKIRQEAELKVKNFMPPYAAEPEIYLKEGKYIGKSQQLQGDGIEQLETIGADTSAPRLDDRKGAGNTEIGRGPLALPPPTTYNRSLHSSSRVSGTTTKRRAISRERKSRNDTFVEESTMTLLEGPKLGGEEPTGSTTKESEETALKTEASNVPNGDADQEGVKTTNQQTDASDKRLGKDGTATIRSSQRGGVTGEEELVGRMTRTQSDSCSAAAQTTKNDLVYIEKATVRLIGEDGKQAEHVDKNVVQILDHSVGEGSDHNHDHTVDVVHRTVLSLESSTSLANEASQDGANDNTEDEDVHLNNQDIKDTDPQGKVQPPQSIPTDSDKEKQSEEETRQVMDKTENQHKEQTSSADQERNQKEETTMKPLKDETREKSDSVAGSKTSKTEDDSADNYNCDNGVGKLDIQVSVVELENTQTQTDKINNDQSNNGNDKSSANRATDSQTKEQKNTVRAPEDNSQTTASEVRNKSDGKDDRRRSTAEESDLSDSNRSPSKRRGSKIPLSIDPSIPKPRNTGMYYQSRGKRYELEDDESSRMNESSYDGTVAKFRADDEPDEGSLSLETYYDLPGRKVDAEDDASRTARTSGYASGGRPGSPSSGYGDVLDDDEAENLLFLLYSGNLTSGEVDSTKEKLRHHLEQLRSERRMYEGKREELIRRARALQSKSNQNRDVARETWRRRYLEAKRITPRLEDECAKMRLQLDQLHRELLARLQAGVTALGRMEQPSNKLSYKIMIARLLEEIEDLRSRVDSTRIRLATEIRLRSQAEKDVRTLREELMKKKIQVTLTRNQQQSAFGPAIRSSFYVNPV